MNKTYLSEVLKPEVIEKIKVGDILDLEMPSFCSGDYRLRVAEDGGGKYVREAWIKGCRDFTVLRKGKTVEV